MKCCCLWIIEKFTLIHQQNDDVKINNYGFREWPHWKRWRMIHFGGFSTYVANDAVFVRQKVHLEGFFFLFFFLLRAISLLFHFKAFLFLLRPSKKHFKVTKYAEKTHVFKGKGVHDSGQLRVIFWYWYLSLIMVCDEDHWYFLTHGKWFHPSYIPSLTSDL